MQADGCRRGAFPLAVAMTLVAMGVCVPAGAVSEAYLAAVRAELDEVTTGHFDLPAGSPWVRNQGVQAKLDLSSPEYQHFDKMLRTKMPGTYIRYRQLPPSKQQALFNAYVADGDIARLRRAILATIK